MAPDLDPGRCLAHAIGVVNDRRGQPQHSLLHRLERGQALGSGRLDGHGGKVSSPIVTASSPAAIDEKTVRRNRPGRYDRDVPRAELDGVDHQILELLVADARRSASEIGRTVGLSPAAAKRRIDRLEELGFIRGYTALLDHQLLGSQLQAFSELRFAPGTLVEEIDAAVADLPELVESFTLAGDPDALLRLRVRDVDHLKQVIDRVRRTRRGTAKIINTKTLIVLGSRSGPAS
jgi:Lrp/AsnC family leucine-responsive transcriptional regulator